MKHSSFALALSTTAIISSLSPFSTAWAFSLDNRKTISKNQHTLRKFSTTLTASIAPDESTAILRGEPAFTNQPIGEKVAEGTIVTFFKGGLAAVQLNDVMDSVTTPQSPTLPLSISTTDSATGDDLTGRLVLLPDGSRGVVIAQRPPIAFVFSDRFHNKHEGKVKIMDTMASIDIGTDITLIDCFGTPVPKNPQFRQPIFSAIPKVADIALIDSPMLTGTTMVDALAPIGRGQNMLVIGSHLDQMRDLACNFVAGQVGKKSSKCVYATTKDRNQVLSKLNQLGIQDDILIVAAREPTLNSPVDDVSLAAESIVCAATACSIGEAFAKQGMDALVIIDTLDEHKTLWDATTRVLVDVYGADAVVAADRDGGASSEMRAFYSSLIQRAAQYNKKNGGGSLTLTMLTTIPSTGTSDEDETIFSEEDFEQTGDRIKARIKILTEKKIPLSESNLRKLEIPIPTATEGKRRLALQHIDDLISMSDGQIWLDNDLAAAGQSPPLDPKRSITRVGIGADTQSRADAPALRRVVEGLRLDLAQAASMDGAEETAASLKQMRRRDAWLLAMHQEICERGRTLSESCVTLLAACSGSLDGTIDEGGTAGSEKGSHVISELLEHMWSRCPSVMEEIDRSLDITEQKRTELEESIKAFFMEKA